MTRIVAVDIAKYTIEIPIEAAEKIMEDVEELTTHRKDPRMFKELEKLARQIRLFKGAMHERTRKNAD